MYGAIIGDVAGSYREVLEIASKIKKCKRNYEDRIEIMDKSTSLFENKSSCTDDSILTVAIADAIMSNISYEEKLKEYGLREINLGVDIYGRSRFGKGFCDWLLGEYQGDSYGNGSAMRISPIGFLFNDLETIKQESYKATVCSHNHIDSIKCSEVVAISIYLLRNGMNKEELKCYIEQNYFSLNYELENLRNNYEFTSKAIESVPQAIFCFLQSNDFEDAIRKAISIGGDCDTIATITGSLAEAYYGIPNELIEKVKPYIRDYMIDVIEKFYTKEKVKSYGKYS